MIYQYNVNRVKIEWMNIVVACQTKEFVKKFKELKVTHLLINDEYFSSGACGLSETQLKEMIDEIHNNDLKAIVKVDRLYQEDELLPLQAYLQYLVECQTDGILYSDLTLKVLIENNHYDLESYYAPETLLTNSYDVTELRNDGFKGCVISKDIPLSDVYDIVNKNPDYCYLRVFGPILISYARRRFISIYQNEDKEYLENYYLQEASRNEHLPIIEKRTGCWLYGPTLQSLEVINDLMKEPFKGLIIDNILYDDEFIYQVVKLYQQVMTNKLDSAKALDKLFILNEKINYLSLNEIKRTGLVK